MNDIIIVNFGRIYYNFIETVPGKQILHSLLHYFVSVCPECMNTDTYYMTMHENCGNFRSAPSWVYMSSFPNVSVVIHSFHIF